MRIDAKLVRWAALAALFFGTLTARAADLPRGPDLMDLSVEAEGGKAAFDRCHTRVMKGKVEMASAEGSITIYLAEPNKRHVDIDLPAPFGKAQEGTDGNIAWEKNVAAARVKTGEERIACLREAIFNANANWRKIYQTAECTGEQNVAGTDCYVVIGKGYEGRPDTLFIDKNTHLIIKMNHTIKRPEGEFPAEIYLSDYRKVDGIVVAHKLRHRIGSQEIVIMLNTIENNAQIPSSRFDVPDDIKKLAEKEKAASGDK